MDNKNAVMDTLNTRPMMTVNLYGIGGFLVGMGVALVLTLLFPDMSTNVIFILALGCLFLGALLNIISYSRLKRNYNFIEKTSHPPTTPSTPNQPQ